MTPTISIIVPTMGRPTLERALGSVVPQLGERDEVLVIGDRFVPRTAVADPRVICVADFSPLTSQYGNRQRNHGQQLAGGDLLCYLDDDDWHAPNSLDVIRRACRHSCGIDPLRRRNLRPLIFRARGWDGRVAWREPTLRRRNVGTCMLVLPNVPEKLAEWPVDPSVTPGGVAPRETDFDFIAATIALWGGESAIAWRPEVIYVCDTVKGYGRLDPRREAQL